MTPTTLLYLPAGNARALAKAPTLDVDRWIVDLEDAVAPEQKAAARDQAVVAIAGADAGRAVLRINALDSPWGPDDVRAALSCRPSAVLAPKVSRVDEVRALRAALGDLPLWLMIETARGVLSAPALADAAGPGGALVFGSNDLLAEMGAARQPDRAPLWSAMSTLVLAARAARLWAFDGVYNTLGDDLGLRAEAQQARAFGFDGKTLIHPAQIGPCREGFAPTPDEVVRARAVVDAFAAAPGAAVLRVDGQMVERMHLRQAERTLARVV